MRLQSHAVWILRRRGGGEVLVMTSFFRGFMWIVELSGIAGPTYFVEPLLLATVHSKLFDPKMLCQAKFLCRPLNCSLYCGYWQYSIVWLSSVTVPFPSLISLWAFLKAIQDGLRPEQQAPLQPLFKRTGTSITGTTRSYSHIHSAYVISSVCQAFCHYCLVISSEW